MTDSDRIDRLEREIAELRREIADLRGSASASVNAAEARPVLRPAAPPAPPTPTIANDLRRRLHLDALPHDREDVEAVVGRYGTVAIAALLILMGVGAFLTWAIGVVTIGPRLRVALGVVLGIALGAGGWRLRTRATTGGARRFGDVLLALALAVVHVDAWGAGPYLGLVPQGVALTIAAAASAALSLLAWSEREQALFVVGVGGALVAPFVTSAAPGHPYVLPTYGWLVLATGAFALPRAAPGVRPWAIATRLLGLGAAAYAAAMVSDASAAVPNATALIGAWSPRAHVPVLFGLACAGAALLAAAPSAGWLALAYVTTTLGAIVALALNAAHGAMALVVFAGVANVVAYVALDRAVRDGEAGTPLALARARVTGVILPLALLGAALVALAHPLTEGATLGGVWAAMAVAAALLERDPARPLLGAHAVVVGLSSALAVALLLRDDPNLLAVGLAAHGAACAVAWVRLRRRGAVVPAIVSLTFAALGAAKLLVDRTPFAYAPFLTRESITAAAVVAAWIVLAERARHLPNDVLMAWERDALVAAAALVALLWGRTELAHAGSPEVATFLLVGYFAAAGIASIFAGRLRRVPAARQAGLVLALYAAFKALVQASTLAAVGLRVGSYLVVGAFLLGVGYAYRDTARVTKPAMG